MLAYEESKSCQELEGNACSPPLGGDPDETRVYPFRFLYDTDDVRHVSPFPWPGLRKLVWPDAHEMLPKGVGEDLLAAYSEIAAEAAAATSPGDSPMAQQGDAYESIAADKKWTKLVLYDARAGWDEELCKNLGTVCRLLRGKFRTEQEPLRSAYQTGLLPYGDEAVILFRVAAGGTAPLHMGQDARINVHLCLLNCNASQIAVGGDLRNYSDSSLFAFGTPTPLSPLFLRRFPPVLRRAFAVLSALSGFLAPRRRERAKNGEKWAKFGGETGEKQRWLSGVGGSPISSGLW